MIEKLGGNWGEQVVSNIKGQSSGILAKTSFYVLSFSVSNAK